MDPALSPATPPFSLFVVGAGCVAGGRATDRTEAEGLFAVRALGRGGDRWTGNMIDREVWLPNLAIPLVNWGIACMNP
jgi:hypothetical protein